MSASPKGGPEIRAHAVSRADVVDRGPRVAVLVPCYNEEATVASVVRDFLSAFPGATVYVYDNNSTDATTERAAKAGAVVRHEPTQGKGNVVRRMFADIDADVYVLVDGDDTYDAAVMPAMIQLLLERDLDMVVGRRIHDSAAAYRRGHVVGNTFFTQSVRWLFGRSFDDILSGYRVFSRRFVRCFPIFASGFEIEAELSVHALMLRLPVLELDTRYKARPSGSFSKLNTFSDGLRILTMILRLLKNERPLLFFSTMGLMCFATSIVLAYPIILMFLQTGTVPRFPTAVLSTGLAVTGFISMASGVILDAVTRGRKEAKLLAYLAIEKPSVGGSMAQRLGVPTEAPSSNSGLQVRSA